MTVVWLAAFVVFLAAEALTVSLTSVWFAGGAREFDTPLMK